MAVYRRPSRTRYVLAVLVLAAVTLVTIDSRSNGGGILHDVRGKVSDVFSPLQRGTHAVLRPIGNFLTGALDYSSLKSENERLRSQIANMQNQSLQTQAEKAAEEQVLGQQNLPFVGKIATVSVAVIDNGYSNFENTITIDKGKSSGVAPGQPVVDAGGLIGSVLSASNGTAVIELVTDPAFVVGVALPNGNTGAAEGQGRNNPLKVTVLSTNQKQPSVSKGQALLTSGLDNEKFPATIPVGTVISAQTPPGETEPEITISPVADLNSLSYLQVLLWSPQG